MWPPCCLSRKIWLGNRILPLLTGMWIFLHHWDALWFGYILDIRHEEQYLISNSCIYKQLHVWGWGVIFGHTMLRSLKLMQIISLIGPIFSNQMRYCPPLWSWRLPTSEPWPRHWQLIWVHVPRGLFHGAFFFFNITQGMEDDGLFGISRLWHF